MTNPKGKSNYDRYMDAVEKERILFERAESAAPGAARQKAIMAFSQASNEKDRLLSLKDIPNFSDTCKKRLLRIFTEQTTGRIKDFESVYIEKGLKTEEDSITLYSLRTNTMYRKNKEKISNGYVIGEIDFDDEEKDMIIDTKSSWDIFSFDETSIKPINPMYEWQGQMYMWLKNRKKFRLAYCLNNTPSEMLYKLKQRLRSNFYGTEEEWQEAVEALERNHIYDDLPESRRLRIYDIERNDEMIDKAKFMIPHFRNYLEQLSNNKIQEYDLED